MKRNFVNINVTPEARKRFKYAALKRDMTIKAFMEELSLKLK